MPRTSRQASSTKVYHVILRGNERKKIFLDDGDRIKFIHTLFNTNKEKAFSVYAFCLMDNHVHLLINEGQDQITKIMQRITVRYAYYFNKKYDRTGHLFQDRFRSEAIENESYLLAAIRYIHNNPVKANVADNPARFRWSSYNAYVDSHDLYREVIDRNMILSMLSDDEDRAVKLFIKFSSEPEYKEFMDIQENPGVEKSIFNVADARLLITDFMNKHIQPEDVKDLMKKKEIRNELIRQLKTNSTLSVREIAEVLDVDRNIVQRVK